MRARRWAAWARQFKERHERVGRRCSPAMVLVRFRGGAPVQRIWQRRVWVTVQPQSTLQIHVQQVLKAPPAPARSTPASAPVRIPRSIPTVVKAVRRESPMPVARMEARRGAVDAVRNLQAPVAHANVRGSRVDARVITESIARQVIRRTERVEEFVRNLRKGTAVAVEAEPPARRVLRENVRREEMLQPAAMALRSTPAAPSQPAPQRQAEEEPVRERQAVPPTQPMAALNLDLVTSQVMDQIDRRVIAWRERMGKF